MKQNSDDNQHFLMNNERCKDLNDYFWKFVMLLTYQKQDGNVTCSNYNCKLEILVKFNDDKTTISINENIEGKMLMKKIGILSPGIASIALINIYKLDKRKMKDYVITYL